MKWFLAAFAFVMSFSLVVLAQQPQPAIDPNALIEFFKNVSAAYSTGGIVLAASAAVFGLVKLLRLGWIQTLLGKISPKLVWANWPKPVCAFVVFVTAGGVAFVTAVLAGTPWIAAIPLAITAGLGAMGTDAFGGALAKPASTNANPS